MDITLNTWHCENGDCEAVFYTDFADEPLYCPFCGGTVLTASKVLTAEPIIFKTDIK